MTEQMIITIIPALVSIWTLFRTHQNSKEINRIKLSDGVNKDFIEARYQKYNELMIYVNSWYDIKPDFRHNYYKCAASRFMHPGIFDHRLCNIGHIKNELQNVVELSKNYFYYDEKTYTILKNIELYLSEVVSYYTRHPKIKFNIFAYIVYCDIYDFICKLSKLINAYFKNKDSMDFVNRDRGIDKKVWVDVIYKTSFAQIYLLEEYFEVTKKEIEKKIKEVNKVNNATSKIIENEDNAKRISELKKIVKRNNKYFNALKKAKNKLCYKKFSSDMVNMWEACLKCRNNNCKFKK